LYNLKEGRKVVETAMNKIVVIMANMDFRD